jgi:hypothetical protein
MRQVLLKGLMAATLLMVVLVLFAAAPGPVRADPPDGSIVYCAATNKYYQLVEGSFTWDEANAKALAMPAYKGRKPTLALPKAYLDNYTIVTKWGTKLHGAWLGGLREQSSNLFAPWFWIDGSQIVYFYNASFNNTAGKEDRLQYWKQKDRIGWNDNSRNAQGGFVVQYK